MFRLIQSSYRVNKINKESKNAPYNAAHDIAQHDVNELNPSVKRIFESDKAYVVVNKNDQGLYDVEFHSGIKGPINYVYFMRRFLLIQYTLSTLKYALTKCDNENEIIKDIRERCRHIDASKIDINLFQGDGEYESYYGVIHNLPSTFVYSSKYRASDLIQIMTSAAGYATDVKTLLLVGFTNFGDSYFSLNNTLSFIEAELNKNKDYCPVASGETEADKIQASKRIHDALVQHKIISESDRYSIKKEGIQPGIILYGKDRDLTEQRTFIKRINPESGKGLYEMMVLQIAKECGCVVPDIQVVMSHSFGWNLMSKDVSGAGYNKYDAKQRYQDLREVVLSPDTYLDTKNYCIHAGRQADESFNKIAYIDKLSIARIILMCVLFNLGDIHLANIGFRFRESDKKTTAELVLLDFEFSRWDLYEHDSTIAAMVARFTSNNNFDCFMQDSGILKKNTLEELCKGLTFPDYVEAFQAIKENFVTAHTLATTHSRKLMKDHLQSELRFGLFSIPPVEFTKLWTSHFRFLDTLLHAECKQVNDSERVAL